MMSPAQLTLSPTCIRARARPATRVRPTSVSMFGGFDVSLAEQWRGLRRNLELDHRARDLRLFGRRHQRDARRARFVQEARQRPDIVRSGNADHDVGLLNADLEVASSQIIRHGTAAGENRLRFQLLGETELRNTIRDVRTAASARIAD